MRREPRPEVSNVWEPIVPFGDYTLPPFPVEVLPGWMQAFVRAEADRTQTPLDLAGMLSLSVVALSVANTYQIGLRAGWYEPLNLFIAVSLPPASRKSAVFGSIIRPVVEYEREENALRAPAVAASKTDRDILAGRCEKAKQQAVAGKKPEEQEAAEQQARELAERLETFRVTVPLRLLADDVTQEKLQSLLMEQGGRIAILSPEGGAFDIISGRYTDKGINLDVFLKGHAGDELRVDRVGRTAEYIGNPALTFGLAIQPDVLQGLAAKPGFRGRGLLGRFLFALPESNIGFRAVQAPTMPLDVAEGYAQGIRCLLSLTPDTDREAGNPRPHTLRLTPEAQAQFDHFQAHIEAAMRPDGDLYNMLDWGGKLCGATARLAGLLHLAQWGNTRAEVSLSTVTSAITLAKYLSAHAKAAYDTMGMDSETEGARRLLDWIVRTKREHFTKRDAFNALRGRFKQAAELDKPLALLCERAYIRQEQPGERTSAGRPGGPDYAVNPLTQNTQNTQNTAKGAAKR